MAEFNHPELAPPMPSHPWTPKEDDLVKTLPPAEVSRRIRRTLTAVWSRRRLLGMPDGRTRKARAARR